MDFNGIGTSYSAYETKNVSAKSTNDKKADSTDKSSEKSVYSEISASYEPSSSTSKVTSATDRKAIIAQLKSDTEQRMAQMQSLVTKMFAKQGITIGKQMIHCLKGEIYNKKTMLDYEILLRKSAGRTF